MLKTIQSKIVALGVGIGGVFGGLGTAGAFGVCHSACLGIAAWFASIGIAGIVMPFAFMQDKTFQIISWIVAGISIFIAVLLLIKSRKSKKSPCHTPPTTL